MISHGDTSTYEVNCYVTGIDQLNKMSVNLLKNKFIEKIERAMR